MSVGVCILDSPSRQLDYLRCSDQTERRCKRSPRVHRVQHLRRLSQELETASRYGDRSSSSLIRRMRILISFSSVTHIAVNKTHDDCRSTSPSCVENVHCRFKWFEQMITVSARPRKSGHCTTLSCPMRKHRDSRPRILQSTILQGLDASLVDQTQPAQPTRSGEHKASVFNGEP